MKKKILSMAIAGLSTVALLSACGGGGGDSGGSSTTSGSTVTGSAAKGIIQNGIVTLKNGAGQVLQTRQSPVRTANDGSYTAVLSSNYSGPVFVEITADASTRIIDELTGDPEVAPVGTAPLLESVGVVSGNRTVDINTTPLTSLVAQLAKQSVASGQEISTVLVQQAQLAITSTLGFNPIDTRPVDPRSASSADENAATKKQAVLLAALAKFGQDNPTCATETTRGAQLACAASQFKSAYVGSTISGNQATINIDGTKLTGLTQAISDVSADTTINKTGTAINPATDPATNEIAQAQTDGSFETTTATPEDGFNSSDVAAVKTLFNNLRSNTAALSSPEQNASIETELSEFGTSLNTQATGLEGSSILMSEAAVYGIQFYADYVAAANGGMSREVQYTEDDVYQCTILSGVSRTDGVVTAITPANTTGINNAQFVGCVVNNDRVIAPDQSALVEFRNYMLLTPTQTANTFIVESDSRLCTTANGDTSINDTCLDLSSGQVIDAVPASAGTVASGSLAFENEGSFSTINASIDGPVAAPIAISFNNNSPVGIALADTVDLNLSLNATFQGSTVEEFLGEGVITTVLGQNTSVVTLDEFSMEGSEDDETGAQTGTLVARGSIETSEGRINGGILLNFDSKQATLNGQISVKDDNGTSSNLFNGLATLTDNTGSDELSAFSSVMFTGVLELPNRPSVRLELNMTNLTGTIGEPETGTVNLVYEQDGITVIINGNKTADSETLEISSPSVNASIAPFNPSTATVVSILREGREAALYYVQDARVEYADGSFEQF